jgi:hypothetical protein
LPFRLRQPSSCGLRFGCPCCLGSPDRGGLLAAGRHLRPKRAQLRESVGELALGGADGRLEVEVAWRHRRGHRPALGSEFRIRGGTLVGEARAIALDRLELGSESTVAKLEVGQRRARRLVGVAAFPFRLGPDGELAREPGGQRLGRVELRHRAGGLPVRLGSPFRSPAEPRGGLVPAGMGRREQRRGQLIRDRRAGRLLFGLSGKAARLRAEFREDVVDAGEVRLGLGELLLGLAPSALVAADPRHLLEQWSALLGPQGQRLIDHPLTDEQERVVGEVRGVEQVDQVAQPDALLVQEVLVLATAVQPAAELEHLEVDRQQTVGVVQDERDVGHALGRPLLRPGPDEVLGLS